MGGQNIFGNKMQSTTPVEWCQASGDATLAPAARLLRHHHCRVFLLARSQTEPRDDGGKKKSAAQPRTTQHSAPDRTALLREDANNSSSGDRACTNQLCCAAKFGFSPIRVTTKKYFYSENRCETCREDHVFCKPRQIPAAVRIWNECLRARA